jgi:raffinose/stachyose/melibiose transport system permease protein
MKVLRNLKLHRINAIPRHVLLIFFSAIFLYPILWLVINSFKTNEELFISPWTLPDTLSFTNYNRAITEGNLLRLFQNSVVIAFAVVGLTVLLSAMAAYGITRLKWKLSG